MIRPCRPEEKQAWIDFLDQNFGYQKPQSYAVDFAPLFSPEGLARSRLFVDKNRILSSATLFPMTMVTRKRTLKLGIVGAVATDASARAQGLSSQIIYELEKQAKAERLDAIVLWSDQKDFYHKLAFRETGIQHIFPLDDVPFSDAPLEGKAFYSWDIRQVRKTYETHPIRSLRSENYWYLVNQIQSCMRMQWIDPQGKQLAYLAVDRGKDMEDVIHEWGGSELALSKLLIELSKRRDKLFWLTHPELNDPIRKYLEQIWKPVEGKLCWFKPINQAITNLDDAWFWGLDSL